MRADAGSKCRGRHSAVPWEGPIIAIAQALQDTTVDVIVAGHTHRVSNLMVGNILVARDSTPARAIPCSRWSYGRDVEWAGRNADREEPGRRRAGGRAGNRRRRQCADSGAPQPGNRDAGIRHPARPDTAQRIGDGEHGRRRHAPEVPGGGRSPHELGRSARRRLVSPPSAGDSAKSPGARCSPRCPSATRR